MCGVLWSLRWGIQTLSCQEWDVDSPIYIEVRCCSHFLHVNLYNCLMPCIKNDMKCTVLAAALGEKLSFVLLECLETKRTFRHNLPYSFALILHSPPIISVAYPFTRLQTERNLLCRKEGDQRAHNWKHTECTDSGSVDTRGRYCVRTCTCALVHAHVCVCVCMLYWVRKS